MAFAPSKSSVRSTYAMSHEDNVKKAAEVTRDFVQKYFG